MWQVAAVQISVPMSISNTWRSSQHKRQKKREARQVFVNCTVRDECRRSSRFPNVQLMSVTYHTPKIPKDLQDLQRFVGECWRSPKYICQMYPNVLLRLYAQPALLPELRESQRLPSAPAQLEAFEPASPWKDQTSWKIMGIPSRLHMSQPRRNQAISAKDQFWAQSIHDGFLKVLTWATDIFTKVRCGLVNLPRADKLDI